MKGTAPAKKKPICAKMKINNYTNFELYLFTEEEEDVGEIGFKVLSDKVNTGHGQDMIKELIMHV